MCAIEEECISTQYIHHCMAGYTGDECDEIISLKLELFVLDTKWF